jgi:hypothetical protein
MRGSAVTELKNEMVQGPCAPGFQIEGVLAYFMHLKCQKCIGDDVGDVRYDFTNKIFLKFVLVKMTPDMFYLPYYARK